MDINVTDIGEFKLKKLLLDMGTLREYSDKFEFCTIKDYETLYPEFLLHSIGIGNIFLQIIERNKKYKIVSYEFSKNSFSITDIALWMTTYHAKLLNSIGNKDVYVVSGSEVIDALKFKGNVIVLYELGNQEIVVNIDELPEVTEQFIPSIYKTDTSYCKEIDSVEQYSKIILNGDEIDYIPKIDMDQTKDVLISNGNIIVADYIDDYSGCIGFYNKEQQYLPIAWIHDTVTTVFIDIYEGKSAKIVNVEYKYISDIENLLTILD